MHVFGALELHLSQIPLHRISSITSFDSLRSSVQPFLLAISLEDLTTPGVKEILNQCPLELIILSKESNQLLSLPLLTNLVVAGYAEPHSLHKIASIYWSFIHRNRTFTEKNDLLQALQEHNRDSKISPNHLHLLLENKSKALLENRERLFYTSQKLETANRFLKSIQEVQFFEDLETKVQEHLGRLLNLGWVRIIPNSRADEFFGQIQRSSFQSFGINLEDYGDVPYNMVMVKALDEKWKGSEKRLIERLAKSVAIVIQRLDHSQKIIDIRDQWQRTFDSIRHPIVLINSQYQIVQANKIVRAKIGEKGQLCHKVLFNRDQPCPQCHLGSHFRVDGPRFEQYRVLGATLQESEARKPIYVHIYQNISHQNALEMKKSQSLREAEMGLISSSIAHEINNPLAGILSFCHIIKADLDPQSNLYEDILEIEQATRKCRDIVENLLSLSRAENNEHIANFALFEVLEQAKRISHLELYKVGISVEFDRFPPEVEICAQRAIFLRAFISVLFFFGSIDRNRNTRLIWIGFEQDPTSQKIIFRMKCQEAQKASLESYQQTSVTIAKRILQTQQCFLDLRWTEASEIEVSISIPCPDLGHIQVEG